MEGEDAVLDFHSLWSSSRLLCVQSNLCFPVQLNMTGVPGSDSSVRGGGGVVMVEGVSEIGGTDECKCVSGGV